jgi:intracellular sulfur oxidation DsrE/DsrF family protein
MARSNGHARRVFLERLGTGAVGLSVLAEAPAAAQSVATPEWRPRRHAEDDWLDRIPGVHRFVLDTTSPAGFEAALRFVSNYFTANHDGYRLDDQDLAVVIVARHHSTPFAYTDVVWKKYGVPLGQRSAFTDPDTKQAPIRNVYRAQLQGLLDRGVHLAVCQMATRNTADVIVRAIGTGDVDSVYKELVGNLVSNAHMVPAGIVAVNRAQERGYAFAHAAGL